MDSGEVTNPMIDELLDAIERLKKADLLSIVVFGSVARNESRETSDLDLVVIHEPSVSGRLVRDRFKAALGDRFHLPVVHPYRADELAQKLSHRPSFVAHLLDEGVELYRSSSYPGIRKALAEVEVSQLALSQEIQEEAEDLDVYADLDRFGGSYISVLANLYATARSIVISQLLRHGVHEYDWREVFESYAEVEPNLRDELASLMQLRPYYEYARNRRSSLPSNLFPGRELAERALSATRAVAELEAAA